MVGTVNVSTQVNGDVWVEYNMITNNQDFAFELGTMHVYLNCSTNAPRKIAPGQFGNTAQPENLSYGKVVVKNPGCTNFWIIAHANVEVCPKSQPSATSLSITPQSIQAESLSVVEEPVVENDIAVYPVPFSEVINVDYRFDYTSDVSIEIFDFGGNLLRTVKDTGVSRGSTTSINVDFAISANKAYLVRVTTDRESFVKQILSSKR